MALTPVSTLSQWGATTFIGIENDKPSLLPPGWRFVSIDTNIEFVADSKGLLIKNGTLVIDPTKGLVTISKKINQGFKYYYKDDMDTEILNTGLICIKMKASFVLESVIDLREVINNEGDLKINDYILTIGNNIGEMSATITNTGSKATNLYFDSSNNDLILCIGTTTSSFNETNYGALFVQNINSLNALSENPITDVFISATVPSGTQII